jgi:DNA ligase-1
MSLETFASTAQAIAAVAGKLEKVALLAAYFRTLDDSDLAAATRFFTGRPFAARDERTLSVGGSALLRAARRLWNFSDSELSAAYARSGDLGTALGSLVRPPLDLLLLEPDALTLAGLAERFGEIAAAQGPNAAKRRDAALERLLRSCATPQTVAYVVKIITGDLRVGLREGLVVDAIAAAFGAESAAVRRALMAAGDIGQAALAAKHATLAEVRVAFFSPIGFMLASPIPYAASYALPPGEWALEDKYDGIRAQAHVRAGRAALFTRTFSDVTLSYPEIARALVRLERDVILDGELVAMRDGRVLPFRELQGRLRRKQIDDVLLAGVPLAYVAFDLLADGDDLLIDRPYSSRRGGLETLCANGDAFVLAASVAYAPATMELNDCFAAARARGNEGLMLKRTDSPYAPGRRGKFWLKLKRELGTLDVVVVAVEWGHGKRAKVLSDYTFAVRDTERGRLAAIGKAYSGLTDAEIAQLTPWFLAHSLPASARRPNARAGEIPVEPAVVLEIAFDVIARSDLHESGFALRFPRIVRIRDDKPAAEIDTLDRVREMYEAMLLRESGSPSPP